MAQVSEGTISMKSDLNYLPEHKQAELSTLITIIRQLDKVEMIILFGSYARNDWVEDKYDEEHYRYQSDMDILVIIETRSAGVQGQLERDIEMKIDEELSIQTPVSILVHDIEFVNRRLRRTQYFFADIKKEGIMLYDSGRFQLSEANELSPNERKKLAKGDFEYYFEEAQKFKDSVDFNFNKQNYNVAAFLLHQVAERLYTGILLVFTRYKPNTHDLAILRKLANSIDNALLHVFPLDTPENRRLFKLLRKAYVEARYKPSYKITKSELDILTRHVDKLRHIGGILCQKKIDSFMLSSDKES